MIMLAWRRYLKKKPEQFKCKTCLWVVCGSLCIHRAQAIHHHEIRICVCHGSTNNPNSLQTLDGQSQYMELPKNIQTTFVVYITNIPDISVSVPSVVETCIYCVSLCKSTLCLPFSMLFSFLFFLYFSIRVHDHFSRWSWFRYIKSI